MSKAVTAQNSLPVKDYRSKTTAQKLPVKERITRLSADRAVRRGRGRKRFLMTRGPGAPQWLLRRSEDDRDLRFVGVFCLEPLMRL